MRKKYDWLVWKLTNVSVESEEDGDTKSRVFINGIDAVMPNSDSFYDCKGEYRRFGEDLSVFDYVINTDQLGVDGVIDIVYNITNHIELSKV